MKKVLAGALVLAAMAFVAAPVSAATAQAAVAVSATVINNCTITTTPVAFGSYAAPVRWGTAGGEIFTPGAAPSKVARTYNVCGQIPASQDLAAATFSDS